MLYCSSLLRRLGLPLATAATLLLSACSTLDRGTAPPLQAQSSWVVLPFANHTETPLAGNRAEAIAAAVLHAQGIGSVRRAPDAAVQEALFSAADNSRQEDALAWARDNRIRYALAGAVEEWRYKVGVDGEPAAGVTLQIIDVQTGELLWSGTGGKSGWSREALSAVAQQLIRKLLRTGLAQAR